MKIFAQLISMKIKLKLKETAEQTF